MKFLFEDEDNRIDLPKGRINIRWSKSRNVYQCYAGTKVLDGASGDTEEEAYLNLNRTFNTDDCKWNTMANQ